MTMETTWHVLVVDDDAEACEQIAQYLNDQAVTEGEDKLAIATETDFDKALKELSSKRYDLIILDVRIGSLEGDRENEAGLVALDSIKQRRFIPVIFYTGLPNKVRHLETQLIRVVEKTEGVIRVLETIKEIFSTRLPFVNRVLLRHLEKVQRDYMWEFVATNWEKFGDTPDRTELAYLLARRLAKSLDGPGIRHLAQELGDSRPIWCDEENVHPMMCYIIPPVTNLSLTGDLFCEQIDGGTKYWVLLTPSCYIEKKKAEWMLLAICLPLKEQEEFTRFSNNPEDASAKGKMTSLLKDNRQGKQPERFKFLPGVLDIPDLVVDFQQLRTISKQEFVELVNTGRLNRIASLDSPYAEALLARFARYYSRLGVPDLHISLIIDKLTRPSS